MAGRPTRSFAVGIAIATILIASFFCATTIVLIANSAVLDQAVGPDPALDLLRGRSNANVRDDSPNRRVAAFYYPWYRTQAHDGKYRHWNHELLPHWTAAVNKRYGLPGPRHDPAANGLGDIGSVYYPSIGPYSSLNRTVVQSHMAQLRRSGVGVVVVSWYPPQTLDDFQPKEERLDFDSMIPSILDDAKSHGMRVALHLEPYSGRDAFNSIEAIQVACRTHGRHSAYHKVDGRPVFYVYDSYRIKAGEWGRAIQRFSRAGDKGNIEIRPYLYMLWVERGHEEYLDVGQFDGAYTYFASEGMVWGSSSVHWPYMTSACRSRGKRLSVSVGPGYDDSSIRPWNAAATKDRQSGSYYRRMLRNAMDSGCEEISITSWNEWHEGTQIEPAAGGIETSGVRRNFKGGGGLRGGRFFPSYEGGPNMYVELTRQLLQDWRHGIKTSPLKN